MAAKNKRWVANVKTDSTHPRAGLFTKSPSTIARELASRKASPKGPQSGMRMLNSFINRAVPKSVTARQAGDREIASVKTDSSIPLWIATEAQTLCGQEKVLANLATT
jgi:hypothetical protein